MAYTAIDDPAVYFQTKLYTGTSSDHAVTLDADTDMAPNLVWIKDRDYGNYHVLFDTVRGVENSLIPSETLAEANQHATGYLSVFGSDGFTVIAGSTNPNNVNTDAHKYVAWNWKAGTTSGLTTNASTDITPSAYSFNQTAGFSTLAYTGNQTSGAKLAHGLGVKPDMVITKSRAGASGWGVYHKSLGATYGMLLNTTAAKDDDATAWNDVEPDTVNITLGSSINTNKTGTCVAYAFVEKQGYSKFGIYTGNGNADGPFVFLGFKPAWLLRKRTDSTASTWLIHDSKRGFNSNAVRLRADLNNAEDSGNQVDLLSNGFKIRETGGYGNASGSPYIYMAFAEESLVTSTGVPATASRTGASE